jgi:endonuclease YncB( thermonuclease family)
MKNILLILLGISLTSSAFEAIVTAVTDGDTVKIEYQNKTIKVRLAGIDTPELKQEFGQESKKALEEKVLNKTVYIDGDKQDRYGRLIADIKIGSRWINKELVEEGYAWHYKQYSDDEELNEAELNAKKSAIGLWTSENPIPPWSYRRVN